ncbi:MAG TPA: hypothetical protein VIN58_15825 [Roseateles sp.]
MTLLICHALGGCAYLTTYTRSVDLTGTNSVSMDVKQRVVFSQLRSGKEGHSEAKVVCAEPSPDALTILGVSGGLDLSSSSKQASVGATAALAESGAFVGLRTQSIQLLRDAMYRLCEGYAGSAVEPNDFISMQRRYQSTMMGLIAIEQLTRPVVAGQVALASRVVATAGPNALLDKAEARYDEKAAERQKADEAQIAAADKVEKAEADVAGKQAAVKTATDDAAKTSTAEELAKASHALETAKQEEAAKGRALKEATKALKQAEQDLIAARTGASAAAAGEVMATRGSDGPTEAAIKEVADSVEDVVQEINFSYAREACFSFWEKETKLSQAGVAPAAKSLWKESAPASQAGVQDAFTCDYLLKKYADRYVAKSERKATLANAKLLEAQAALLREKRLLAEAEVAAKPEVKPAVTPPATKARGKP